MKRILLCCSAGMSTSMLVERMKKVAADQGKDYKIWATAVDDVEDDEQEFDVVLIGPQVANRYDEVCEIAHDMCGDVPVAVIDKTLYGKMDAEAVLKAAEELLNK